MSDKRTLPNFASEIRELVGQSPGVPPVETWHPEREGEIDIEIARDGNWYYQGELMERASVVQLFSSILRKDGDAFFLVTPAEKMKIRVEDAPFVIRLLDVEGSGEQQKLHVSTNVGDHFTVGESHPLRTVYNDKGEPAPYVTVRRNLEALITRTVYYELAELAQESPDTPDRYGVWSQGQFFLI